MNPKRLAVASCVLTLVFSLALGVTGFFLAGGHGASAYLHRFFFVTTPGLAVITLIAIVRIKG